MMASASAAKRATEFDSRAIGVLTGASLSLALSFAPVFMATLPILMKGIGREFGWDRTMLMGGYTVAHQIVLILPFLGQLIDRVGPRVVIVVGTSIYTATLLAMSLLPPTYWLFLLLAFLIGVSGGGCSGIVGYISLISRWFDRRLGAAVGIANMGVGLGMVLMPLIAQAVDAIYGWRWAYIALAALVGCIALPCAVMFAREPAVDSATVVSSRGDISTGPDLAISQILRTRTFWALAVSTFLFMMAIGGCSAHLFPMLTDRGVSGAGAARMVAVLGGSLLLARLAAGVLLDYIASWLIGTIIFLGVAIGALLLGFVPSMAGVVVAVVLIGAGQGMEGDLLPYVVRRSFGMRNFAACYGLVLIPFGGGAAVGPLVAAQFFDRGAGYAPAFAIFAVSASLAAIIMATLVRRSLPDHSAATIPNGHVSAFSKQMETQFGAGQ